MSSTGNLPWNGSQTVHSLHQAAATAAATVLSRPDPHTSANPSPPASLKARTEPPGKKKNCKPRFLTKHNNVCTRQAFILYEDELTDSKAQVRALVSMAGTLLSCEGFDHADYDSLATKTAQYAAKLLKKPDQCRMVTLCSHLFWAPDEVCMCDNSRRRQGISV